MSRNSEVCRRLVRHREQKCEICDTTQILIVHHIIPVSRGGKNEEENLLIMCPTCHQYLHRIGMGQFNVNDKSVVYNSGKIHIFTEKEDDYYQFYQRCLNNIELGLLPGNNIWKALETLSKGIVWKNLDAEDQRELLTNLIK